MKKIIGYLGVGIIPCAILVLLLTFGTFDSCSERHTVDVIQQVDLNAVKRQVADSITAEWTNRELAKLDSAERKYKRAIRRLNGNIYELEVLIADQVDGIEEDTTRNDCAPLVAKYDSALVLYAQYADTLKRTIWVQDGLLVVKDSTIGIWKQKYRQIETSYGASKLDISILKDELASKSTWWKRNEKWIYFIGGVIGTGFLLK
jgi:hypothetical protein